MNNGDAGERLRVFNLLANNPQWQEILKDAIEWEETKDEEYRQQGYERAPLGWEWYSVHAPMPTLQKMVAEKLLDIELATRSGKHFRVRNPELVKEAINALESDEQEDRISQASMSEEMPNNLFNNIVGHSNIKTLVKLALQSDKPTHVLLSGPPASAKTMFLLELRRIQKPGVTYALAPSITAAGMADYLFTYQPEILLLDEVDRLSGSDIGVLNSLMATGIVSETKYKKTRTMELNTKVFAAGIKVGKLPSDLLSRFVKLKFNPYTEKEFIQVSETVLTTQEGLLPEQGGEIGKAIWDMYHENADIRQCVQVGRLSNGETNTIREVIKTLKQSGL